MAGLKRLTCSMMVVSTCFSLLGAWVLVEVERRYPFAMSQLPFLAPMFVGDS